MYNIVLCVCGLVVDDSGIEENGNALLQSVQHSVVFGVWWLVIVV